MSRSQNRIGAGKKQGKRQGSPSEQRFYSHPWVVMEDETITYLFLQFGGKCLLPTGLIILIPTSVNQVRGKSLPNNRPGQRKSLLPLERCKRSTRQRSEPSQGTVQRPRPRWLEVPMPQLQEMESWGWCGKEKNPLVLIDPFLRLPQKFRTKYHPPPTLQ